MDKFLSVLSNSNEPRGKFHASEDVIKLFGTSRFTIQDLSKLSLDKVIDVFSPIRDMKRGVDVLNTIAKGWKFGCVTLTSEGQIVFTNNNGKHHTLCHIVQEDTRHGIYRLVVTTKGGSGDVRIAPANLISHDWSKKKDLSKKYQHCATIPAAGMLTLLLVRSFWARQMSGRQITLSEYVDKARNAICLYGIELQTDSNNIWETRVFWHLFKYVVIDKDKETLGEVGKCALKFKKRHLEGCLLVRPGIASEGSLIKGYCLDLLTYVKFYPLASWIKEGVSFVVDSLDKAAKLVGRYKGLGLSRVAKPIGIEDDTNVNILITNNVDAIGSAGCSVASQSFMKGFINEKTSGLHTSVAHKLEVRVSDGVYMPWYELNEQLEKQVMTLDMIAPFNEGDVVIRKLNTEEVYLQWKEAYEARISSLTCKIYVDGNLKTAEGDIKFRGKEHLYGGDKVRGRFSSLVKMEKGTSTDCILFKTVLYVANQESFVAKDGTEIHFISTPESIKNFDVVRRTAIKNGLYREDESTVLDGQEIKGVLVCAPLTIELPTGGKYGGSKATVKYGGDKGSYMNAYVAGYGLDNKFIQWLTDSMSLRLQDGAKLLGIMSGKTYTDVLKDKEAWDKIRSFETIYDFLNEFPGASINSSPTGESFTNPVTVLDSKSLDKLTYPTANILNKQKDSWESEEVMFSDDEPREFPPYVRVYLTCLLKMAHNKGHITETHLYSCMEQMREQNIRGRIIGDSLRWDKLLVSATVVFLPWLPDDINVVSDWMALKLRKMKNLKDDEPLFGIDYRYPKLNCHIIPARIYGVSEYNALLAKNNNMFTVRDYRHNVEGDIVERRGIPLCPELNTSVVFVSEAIMNLTNGDSDGDRLFILPLDRELTPWVLSQIKLNRTHKATVEFSKAYADYNKQKAFDCYEGGSKDPVKLCNTDVKPTIMIDEAKAKIFQACRCKLGVAEFTIGYLLSIIEYCSNTLIKDNAKRKEAGLAPKFSNAGARIVQEWLDGIKSNLDLSLDVNEFFESAVTLSEDFLFNTMSANCTKEAAEVDLDVLTRTSAQHADPMAVAEISNMVVRVANGGQITKMEKGKPVGSLSIWETLLHVKGKLAENPSYDTWLAKMVRLLVKDADVYEYDSFEDIAYGVTCRFVWGQGKSHTMFKDSHKNKGIAKAISLMQKIDNESIWAIESLSYEEKLEAIYSQVNANLETITECVYHELGGGKRTDRRTRFMLAMYLIASARTNFSKQFGWNNWRCSIATRLLLDIGAWKNVMSYAKPATVGLSVPPTCSLHTWVKKDKKDYIHIDSNGYVINMTCNMGWALGQKWNKVSKFFIDIVEEN